MVDQEDQQRQCEGDAVGPEWTLNVRNLRAKWYGPVAAWLALLSQGHRYPPRNAMTSQRALFSRQL